MYPAAPRILRTSRTFTRTPERGAGRLRMGTATCVIRSAARARPRDPTLCPIHRYARVHEGP